MTNSTSTYLSTPFQQFIYKSRYSRWLPEENRREEWHETVERYFSFFDTHLKEKFNYSMSEELRASLTNAVLSLQVMPSMRTLMTAGPALSRCNVAGYNCSYVPIDHPRAFDEILYILMCGTGVGFSVEQNNVDKLPIVNEHFEKSQSIITVGDSKSGWAKALRELVAMLYAGQIPTWDLSGLRPAGARLKTFGGRSSGPEPLNDLLKFVVRKFTGAAGRRLTALECHDIVCKIGDVVVVGGVRRSALISLSNLNSKEMQEAKSGRWWEFEGQRALANNSACYTRKPDVTTFMDEWTALIKSQSGERGIFNRAASKAQAAKNGRRDPEHQWGTNPCCVSGDTLILTSNGHVPIEDTVGSPVSIWNGDAWDHCVPYETGVQPTAIVTLSNGVTINCTWNHKFLLADGSLVETNDLTHGVKLAKKPMPVIEGTEFYPIDGYSQGFYSGDGCAGNSRSYVYSPKYAVIPRLKGNILAEYTYGSSSRKSWVHGPMLDKNFVPINGNKEFCLDWLAGVLDADGVVVSTNGGASSLQLGSTNKDFLLSIRLMLTRLGCNAKVTTMHKEAAFRLMPDGRGGMSSYPCAPVWRLLITANDLALLVAEGLVTERLTFNIPKDVADKSRFVTVVSVEEGDEIPTYCFTSSNKLGTFNGVVTGQSEIILRPYQFCNLSEVVVRAEDTLETLAEKVRLATILGTLQSTLTDFKYLRKVWKDNTEEERLLGVSMTGIFDGREFTNEELEQLRNVAVEQNKEFAELLGIPTSTAITCVKPSGTVSQLVDAASGIHPRHSHYYIRTVRGDKKDPLTNFMIAQGIPYEDCVMKPSDTVVFSFPQKAPENGKVRADVTAIGHLEKWIQYQRHWCEHKPSVTINVKNEEWLDVGAWVYKYFDEMSGVSFLPYSEHTYKQAPYQECTKEQYEELLATMPKTIDWVKLADFEKEDTTSGTQELACSAGVCEVVDIRAAV